MRQAAVILLISSVLLTGHAGAYRIIGPWKPMFKGVEHATASTDTPRLEKVNAIRIDLRDPDLSFTGTPSNGTALGDTNRQTGTAFMNSSGCDIGVNTHYYLSDETIGWNADLEGVSKVQGVTVSAQSDDWPIRKGTLLITQNNVASMAKTYTTTNLSSYWTAVESRDGYIMKNGVINVWGDTSIHPRTGVGISQDGRYMVFITVDGRQSGYSDGCTHQEVAEWLVEFGCYNGMNLDGGGSTHMLISGSAGPVTVNSPSEDRAVGSHIGAHLAPLFTPAVQLPPVTNGLIIQLAADSLNLYDNAAVTSWPDNATSDSVDGTVSQVTDFSTPVYKRNIYNGKPVIRFTDDILNSNQFTLPAPSAGITMFAVFTGGGSGLKTERLGQLGDYNGSSGMVIGMEVSTNKTDSDGGSGFRFNNGKALTRTTNPLTTGFHTACWKLAQGAKHSAAIYYVDGFLQNFDSINNPNNTTTFQTSGNIFSVGTGMLNGGWITGDYYTGDVAEILVYNQFLTTTQIEQVQAYLNEKYQVNLPVTDGLIIHLQADKLELNDGDMVKEWPDSTTDDVDGTVYSYADCGIPTFKTNARNGLPAVHFSSAAKQALISDLWGWNETQGVTVFMVNTGGMPEPDCAAFIGDIDGQDYKGFGLDVGSSDTYGSGVRFNNGSCLTSGVSPNPINYGVWNSTVRRIAQGGTYGSLVYGVNSFPAVEVTTDQPTFAMNFNASNNVLALGNARSYGVWVGGSIWYNGDIAEVLVYNKQLSEPQMQSVLDYLNNKYHLYFSPADFELDLDVDVNDFAVLASQWLAEGNGLAADIYPPTGDGKVDLADFAEFAQYWMTVPQ